MLGCGNSTLSEDMYLDGFEDITNVDVRSVVHEVEGLHLRVLINIIVLVGCHFCYEEAE